MLTVITPILEITEELEKTSKSINKICLNHRVRWWIIAPKNTKKKLKNITFLRGKHINIFEEIRPSIWGAYNTVIDIIEDFYLPISVGDILFEDGFNQIIEILKNEKSLNSHVIFFSVVKKKKIVKAKDTWRSILATSGFASGHSSGCIINKTAHHEYGAYDESFDIAADNFLFEKIYLTNKKSIQWVPEIILGEFIGGGMSTIDLRKTFHELFLSRIKAGRNIMIEKPLFYLRRLKYWV